MELRELLAILIAFLSIVLAFYMAAIKSIQSNERIAMEKLEADKIRDRERIEAIVDLRVKAHQDDFKASYNEMMHLIKSGTFK